MWQAQRLVGAGVSFVDSHDQSLMKDPVLMAMRARVTVQPDQALMDPTAPRGAIVQVTMTDGKTVEHFTKYPPGTKENPLSVDAVSAGTRDRSRRRCSAPTRPTN